MRIDGDWLPDDEGILRPLFEAQLLTASGSWIACAFLLDTGADSTVISGEVLHKLGFPFVRAMQQLGGVGGAVETVVVATRMQMIRSDGGKVVIEGPFFAFQDETALELSVLGRDVLKHFSAIVDLPESVLHLPAGRHRYFIQES